MAAKLKGEPSTTCGTDRRDCIETSLRQLQRLDTSIPTLICMYQTGLQPAIMGFYRAVTCHLIEHPKSIAVVPYYYQGEEDFAEGTTWRAM